MDEFNNENQGAENISAENNGAESEIPANGPEIINAAAEPASSEPETAEEPVTEVVNAPETINYWKDTAAANANAPQGSSALAIVSLIMGIISLLSGLTCFCFGLGFIGGIFGIAALITGGLSIVKKKPGKGMAIAGLITGALGTLIAAVSIFVLIGALAGFADAMDEMSGYYSNSYY